MDCWIQTENRQQWYSAPLTHHPDLSLTPLLLTHTPWLSPQAPVIRRDSPPRSADQLADLSDGLVGRPFSATRIGTACFLSIRDTGTHTDDSGCTVAPNLGIAPRQPISARHGRQKKTSPSHGNEGEKKRHQPSRKPLHNHEVTLVGRRAEARGWAWGKLEERGDSLPRLAAVVTNGPRSHAVTASTYPDARGCLVGVLELSPWLHSDYADDERVSRPAED